MKIIDRELLKEWGQGGVCEFCKRPLRHRGEVHHVHTKGAGRIDLPLNIILLGSWLDCNCHGRFHDGHILRDDLLAVVAKREGLTQDEIREEVWRIRRLDRDAVYVPFEGRRPQVQRPGGWCPF